MDVKSSFLNKEQEEEVYIEQLEGFILSKKGRLCLQIEEGIVWTQISPQSMVFKIVHVSTTSRVQERQCRQQSLHKSGSRQYIDN